MPRPNGFEPKCTIGKVYCGLAATAIVQAVHAGVGYRLIAVGRQRCFAAASVVTRTALLKFSTPGATTDKARSPVNQRLERISPCFIYGQHR